MVKYRTIYPGTFHSDIVLRERILSYLEENKLTIPENFVRIYIAEEDEKIRGVSAVSSIEIIEPLKAESAIVAYVLFQKVLAIAPSQGYVLRALTKDESVVSQLKRMDFEVEKENLTMLRYYDG